VVDELEEFGPEQVVAPPADPVLEPIPEVGGVGVLLFRPVVWGLVQEEVESRAKGNIPPPTDDDDGCVELGIEVVSTSCPPIS